MVVGGVYAKEVGGVDRVGGEFGGSFLKFKRFE